MKVPPKDPTLLERLRARLRAGDTVTEACKHCGVSDDVGRGMIRRHGRDAGAAPPKAPTKPRVPAKPKAPPPIFLGALTPPPELSGPKPGCCAWPEGEGKQIRFECRNAPQPGRPYCAKHCSRAFITVRVRTGVPLVFQRLGTTL